MTHAEAVAFWYTRIDYERRAPKPGDLKLDRMRLLLRQLGDPQLRLRAVHVAGTKGKGSTASMLAEILRQSGYRTGLFTSPHLSDVSERIRIDGAPISPPELAARMDEIAPAVRAMDAKGDPLLSPTFFEVGTALGFLHFVRRRADVAVVEVGLGGRFDSTNVITPMLSVITSISFDHVEQLGDRLGLIAFQKAGIVKPGRPVVSGATAPEAAEVIRRVALECRSPLTELDRDFRYRHSPARFNGEAVKSRVEVTTSRRRWPAMELNLLGDHQAANAAVAVESVERLRECGLHVPDEAVARGLSRVRWAARLEVIGSRPWVLLDCAHNVASAEALVETLRETFPAAPRRLAVFATSSDKDVPGILRVLASHFSAFFLTSYRNNPRTVAPERLAAWLKEVAPATPGIAIADSRSAFEAARASAGPDDLIAITGSVFLAGELRPLLVG